MLLDRYHSDTFKFHGEEANKAKEMGKDSYLFEAYQRAKLNGLKL